MYCTVLRLGSSSQMAKRAFDRASSMSFLLPTRVNGWHGGDINIVSIFILLISLALSRWMLRFLTGVSGWFHAYTAFATLLMSNATTTLPSIPLSANMNEDVFIKTIVWWCVEFNVCNLLVLSASHRCHWTIPALNEDRSMSLFWFSLFVFEWVSCCLG